MKTVTKSLLAVALGIAAVLVGQILVEYLRGDYRPVTIRRK